MKIVDFVSSINKKIKKIDEEINNFIKDNGFDLLCVANYNFYSLQEEVEVIISIFSVGKKTRKRILKLNKNVAIEVETNKDGVKELVKFIKNLEI